MAVLQQLENKTGLFIFNSFDAAELFAATPFVELGQTRSQQTNLFCGATIGSHTNWIRLLQFEQLGNSLKNSRYLLVRHEMSGYASKCEYWGLRTHRIDLWLMVDSNQRRWGVRSRWYCSATKSQLIIFQNASTYSRRELP